MILIVTAWALASLTAIPLTLFTLEVIVGARSANEAEFSEEPRRVAVLIPAHNEESGIAETISLLLVEAAPSTRIIVVADNCTDATASVARQAGAEIAERNDPNHRGKGYALAFGRDCLAACPPDIVVVVDADCFFLPGGFGRLVGAVASRGVPMQATNLLLPDKVAPPLVQLSNFAMLVKNRIRARGCSRLGGVALLTGTGMAFPWQIFATAPLDTGNIVEDLGVGLALIKAGIRPQLVEGAEVRSAAAALSEAQVQRRRWEHGFLATALDQAPRLISQGMTERSRSKLAVGLHLLVPPLALLLSLGAFALLLLAGAGALGAGWGPALTLVCALFAALFAVFIIWLCEGRAWLSGAALIRAPLYVLWKIPLYLRYLTDPETRWRRTRRPS